MHAQCLKEQVMMMMMSVVVRIIIRRTGKSKNDDVNYQPSHLTNVWFLVLDLLVSGRVFAFRSAQFGRFLIFFYDSSTRVSCTGVLKRKIITFLTPVAVSSYIFTRVSCTSVWKRKINTFLTTVAVSSYIYIYI